MKTSLCRLAVFVVAASTAGASAAGASWNDEQRGYEQSTPGRGSWNSWYGPSNPYQNENTGNWAFGTFYGRNGANGNEETITIRPDGSVELRTRAEPPKYGSFAGETLTFDRGVVRRVQPARGGIVVDGAYYNR